MPSDLRRGSRSPPEHVLLSGYEPGPRRPRIVGGLFSPHAVRQGVRVGTDGGMRHVTAKTIGASVDGRHSMDKLMAEFRRGSLGG
jgi:hypothetical protein